MSTKGRRLNGEFFDPMYGYVCAENTQPLPDNLKNMIDTIKEALPLCGKDKIAMVLQSCDFNLEKTLSCLTKDGGDDLLGNWSTQCKKGKNGTMINRSKKKRRNRKGIVCNKEQLIQGKEGREQEKMEDRESIQGERVGKIPVLDGLDRLELSSQASEKDDIILPNSDSGVVASSDCSSRKSSLSVPSTPESSSQPSPAPLSSGTVAKTPNQKQSNNKGTKSPNTAVENTVKPKDIDAKKKSSPKEIMKRSIKDLQRSTVCISRFHVVLEDECEQAEKKIKTSFQDLKKCLLEREQLLLDELRAVRVAAVEKLNQRQMDAASLSLRCELIGGMADSQLIDLRADIKRFVGDRKIDEEIAKTSRFDGDHEDLMKLICEFGHVSPLKAAYKDRPKVAPSVSVISERTSSAQDNGLKPNDNVELEKIPVSQSQKEEPHCPESKGSGRTDSLNSIELRERADIHSKLKEILQLQNVSHSYGKAQDGADECKAQKVNRQTTKGETQINQYRKHGRNGTNPNRSRGQGDFWDRNHPKNVAAATNSNSSGQESNGPSNWREKKEPVKIYGTPCDSRGSQERKESTSSHDSRVRNWREPSNQVRSSQGAIRGSDVDRERPIQTSRGDSGKRSVSARYDVDINSNKIEHEGNGTCKYERKRASNRSKGMPWSYYNGSDKQYKRDSHVSSPRKGAGEAVCDKKPLCGTENGLQSSNEHKL